MVFKIHVLIKSLLVIYISRATFEGGLFIVKNHIEERAIELAEYIIDKKTTVRAAAKEFGISKSTVHKDITERLEKINSKLASQARIVLEENKAERHIRGGQATKLKYSILGKVAAAAKNTF